MKASKYFAGALGAATTTGAVVGIGAGIVGLLGGGLLGGITFGVACGFGAGAAVLSGAIVLFPVVKLCSYIDEKTNFFTKAGGIINTPFEKLRSWVKNKFASPVVEDSPSSTESEEPSPEETPVFDSRTTPSAPPKPRLNGYTLGSESPPPRYEDLPKHKRKDSPPSRSPSS